MSECSQFVVKRLLARQQSGYATALLFYGKHYGIRILPVDAHINLDVAWIGDVGGGNRRCDLLTG